MSEQENVKLVRRWVDLLGRWGEDPQDIARAMDLLDPDIEWVLMATGERYRGIDSLQKMSAKSMAAISHSEQNQLKITNLFGCEDKVCLEYVHGALLKQPGQATSIPIEMAICIVFQCKNGKIAKANEYYEVEQLQGPGAVKPLYADSQ